MSLKQKLECWSHFPSFCYHFLKIWTKPDDSGKRHFVPLKWNLAQRRFWPDINPKGDKAFFLKSRQVGWTTICQAFDFWICVTRPAAKVQLLTHNEELQGEMYDRVDIFLENLPAPFKVKKKSGNRKTGFRFAGIPGLKRPDGTSVVLNSAYGIMTVGGKQKGIGKSLDVLHMTEVARWEDIRGDMERYISTAMQAVPKGGWVIMETTPDMYGHVSHRLWRSAKSGKKKMNAVFMPWWFDETAVRQAPENFVPADKKEVKLLKWGASPENLMFRREKIAELTSDEYDGETLFNREYPSTDRDCWLSRGKNAFSIERLIEQEKRIEREEQERKPKVGDIELNPERYPYFQPRGDGDLTIWRVPNAPSPCPVCAGAGETALGNCNVCGGRGHQPTQQYVIGADVGKGKQTGDYSAACVLNAYTLEQVAEYHGKPLPEEFGYILDKLARFYNNALLAVESNGDGYTAIQTLCETLHYPNLYRHEKTQRGYAESSDSYGWNNNAATRSIAVNTARNIIGGRRTIIRSKALIDELLAFVADESGKFQAPKGAHDDLAMAFMISLWAAQHGAFQPLDSWYAETPMLDSPVPMSHEPEPSFSAPLGLDDRVSRYFLGP
jgi:hypothetical protein